MFVFVINLCVNIGIKLKCLIMKHQLFVDVILIRILLLPTPNVHSSPVTLHTRLHIKIFKQTFINSQRMVKLYRVCRYAWILFSGEILLLLTNYVSFTLIINQLIMLHAFIRIIKQLCYIHSYLYPEWPHRQGGCLACCGCTFESR